MRLCDSDFWYCKEKSYYDFLESVKKYLTEVLIVSDIEIFKESDIEKYFEILPGIGVKVLRANGSKCARCWCYSEYVNEAEGRCICQKCEEVLESKYKYWAIILFLGDFLYKLVFV